ncbi:MAG: flagellar biosynthetic protein FliO [Planctomycetes bacterium]|nr:flagellar biosynthetic protein FliO [Planctomycetota bacterium]
MGLWVALLVWGSQDPRLPLPPQTDVTVPLEIPATEKAAEARPLAMPPAPARRLSDRPEAAGPSLGGFLFWSCAVIALLVGAFLLFKRFARGSRLFRANAAVDVLARRSLAPRQEILLVAVGGRVLILGSTRERVSTLGEIADPDEVARLRTRLAGASDETAAKAFGETLKSGIRDYEKSADPDRGPRLDGVFEELATLKKTVQAWRA